MLFATHMDGLRRPTSLGAVMEIASNWTVCARGVHHLNPDNGSELLNTPWNTP